MTEMIQDLKHKTARFCTGEDCPILGACKDMICRGNVVSSLAQLSKIIVESDNLTSMLSMTLAILKDKMGVDKGMVNLFNSKTGKIFIYDSIGLTDHEKARGVYSLGEGITGKVVENGRTIVVPKISEESGFLNRTQSHASLEDCQMSFICIPILRGRKVLGTISVERFCENPELLKYDVELLETLASLMAQAVELYLLENEEKPFWKMENARLQNALKERFHPSNIIGNSKPMLEVYNLIEKIATTQSTVLLLGKSGVGKELVANAIHYHSLCSDGPLVKFNCAALPESLIESELFGHEKGAFTGANATRIGRFEEADGGTIFLDEVGELSLSMQAKLLRVLQERVFERVGGNKRIEVDIRVIAATNRNLSEMVSEGTFREDLFYRLNVFPILIPDLCKRGSDILTLADHFASQFSKRIGKEVKKMTTPVQEMLLNYRWPGNVRELENVMERAVILSEDSVLHVDHFPLSMQRSVINSTQGRTGIEAKLEAIEYEMIVEALTKHQGSIEETCTELEVSRRILGIRMEKYGINFRKFKGSQGRDPSH